MDYKKKALELQKEGFMVDAHLDLAGEVCFRRVIKGEKEVIKNNYLKMFKETGYNVIICAIYVEQQFIAGMALKNALDQISTFYDDIAECNGEAVLIKNKKDLEYVLKEDKIGFILSFEGVEPLVGDIKMLNIFYELGVRAFSLTWSRRNEAADGCHFGPVEEGHVGGVTNYGIQLINEAEKRNMILDAVHINEVGFWDLVKFSTKPFIVSHSNTTSVYDMPRNLTDEQIKAIKERNGVIGVNAVKPIVAPEGKESIEFFCNHIDKIKEIAGIDHVGYGFDLCNNYIKHSPFELEDAIIDLINDFTETTLITAELIKRGYTDEEVKKIIGGNFIRILRELLPE